MREGYRGRFAPSPTGPLHFGSLVTALAGYLDVRSVGGRWLVRIEDVDRPRCVPDADTQILETLQAFGLHWDEPVLYQSDRTVAYQQALDRLRSARLAYPCSCTRRETGTGVYSGTCRDGVHDPNRPISWRVRDDAEGDFVLLRSDGYFAYQLAVVVDDEAQGITNVVRGADLLESTPRQNHLQRLLGFRTPEYLHVPLVTNPSGEKLSKQTNAAPLRKEDASNLLKQALLILGQPVPKQQMPPEELLAWSALRWSRASAQDAGSPGR